MTVERLAYRREPPNRRGRHVLLVSGPAEDLPQGMRTWRDQIEIVTTSAALLRTGRIYLLRPDGYLAARGSVASPDNLISYLTGAFRVGRARQLAPALEQHDLRGLSQTSRQVTRWRTP